LVAAGSYSWHGFFGNWHYLYIHNDVLLALRARGVTEAQIHTMMVENPERILGCYPVVS
jgi:predicted metal-dependent phosphotriesterase family hydrolase